MNISFIDIHYILNLIKLNYILTYTYSNYFNKYTQINNHYYIHFYLSLINSILSDYEYDTLHECLNIYNENLSNENIKM